MSLVHPLFPPPRPLQAAAWRGMRVGLFGGSFNPAHRAHRQLADYALRRLKLDAVWWLVSPQNPMKSSDDMMPLVRRLESARAQAARSPRMVVTDLEVQLGTQYTADTIAEIQRHFPYTQFTWMMGADSLRSFHRWENWRDIARRVPIAVFARPPQQMRALSGFTAKTLRKSRRKSAKAAGWQYVMMPLNPLSATQIRKQNAKKH